MFFKKKNLEIISNTYKLLQEKYKKKQNIQLFLKNKTFSNREIIKLAYDIQSGSYIKFFKKLTREKKVNVYFPLIKAINDNFKNVKTILDFGCGELTTSAYIFKNLNHKIKKYYANDVSFNRLLVGSNELKKKLTKKNYNKFKIFCNSDNNLPFKDKSIDLVLTVHALEPNNQYKYKIFNELLRVSKLGIILMEPHYEISDVKQKKRMIKFDYIRGIEKILRLKKIKYHIIEKKFHLNNLNKSSIFILKNNLTKKKQHDNFVDPIKKNDLIKKDNFLYSKKTFRAFPIINDIAIFNEDSQIFLPNLK